MTGIPTLLVIEDDSDAAAVVSWLMESRGYTCEVIERAEDALTRLAADHGAVKGVIVDFHLPGIDGIEFGRRLRATAHGRDIPMIGTTAFHTPELRATAMTVGFNAYFAKPLNVSEFAPAVESLVGH